MTEKVLMHLYEHNFGLLIPCESGVLFEQQTDGVCCHHVRMEGVFLPLRYPIKYNFDIIGNTQDCMNIDLLEELQDANYNFQSTEEIWNEILRTIEYHDGITMEFVDWSDVVDQVMNEELEFPTEGFAYVKITKLGKHFDGSIWDLTPLIGKTLVLIYPNCD